jgi:hypothetical protein
MSKLADHDDRPSDKDENENVTSKVEKLDLNNSNKASDDGDVLVGFKGVKLFLMSGDIEAIYKKKKFNNLFDYILLGFHSKNIISTCSQIGKPNFKLILELCTYMSCFKEKDKEASIEKLKEIAKENKFRLEDTTSKAVWKFLYKNDTLKQDTEEQIIVADENSSKQESLINGLENKSN